MSIRILIVDDHPLFREALAAVAGTIPDVDVAGMAGDGASALAAAAKGGVDVVLLDLGLPDMSGLDAAVALRALPDPPAILVVTMSNEAETVHAALAAGADGYLLKGATADQVAAAIRTVASGGAVLGGGVRQRFAGPEDVAVGAEHLTARERQVLHLLAEGASNKQIARQLGLSVKTVQNYVSRLLDKLQVTDRTQAALAARQLLR